MKRLVLTLVFPAMALVGSDACAQWIFKPPEPWLNQAGKHLGQAAARVQSFASGSAYDPAVTAPAPAPAPSSEWDQSGVIGRRDRDAAWHHDERMQWADSYLRGLRDGAEPIRPIWGPYPPPPPGPLPPILGTPGHGRPPRPTGKRP